MDNLGIYKLKELVAAAANPKPYLIEGLLEVGSVNALVGSSGLGKTPFCVQMALCVATGTPFLGLRTTPVRVLYADMESGIAKFSDHVQTLARFLGIRLDDAQMEAWSPTWSPSTANAGDRLLERVEVRRPDLVIVDPLRPFFPSAETESKEASRIYTRFRAHKGVTWLIVHHTRKPSQEGVARLDHDPWGWMNEAAGSAALINHADGRLGIENAGPNRAYDTVVGGFVRALGVIPTLRLQRILDEDHDDPLGYAVMRDWDLLGRPFTDAVAGFKGETFRFNELKRKLCRVPGGLTGPGTGMAPNKVSKLLREAQAMGFIEKVPGGYKTTPRV